MVVSRDVLACASVADWFLLGGISLSSGGIYHAAFLC